MDYTPIIGTLGYILSDDRQSVLMVHRTHRPDDDHLGKYNGLGGHMESNEDVQSSIKREIHEEAGIQCLDLTLRGIINWTGFGPNSEDWLVFIFLINQFEGTPFEKNEEGPLEWVRLDQMATLPMWEGDRHFIPLVFDNDPRVFYGYMPYQGDRSVGWHYHR